MSRLSGRVEGESGRLDPTKVLGFFEGRAARIPELGPTRAVIYQDHHPDLAERRDAHERRTLAPLLRLDGDQRLLDIGCGTGRWTRTLAAGARHYHGLDFSPGLVEHAREAHADLADVQFSVADASDFTLASIGEDEPFDRVLVSGVLIYLNDEAVDSLVACVAAATAPGGLVLLREPVAQQDRLTLVDHHSEDLGADYHAVYRTRDDLLPALGRAFAVVEQGPVYDDPAMNNRAETRQEWFVLTPLGDTP